MGNRRRTRMENCWRTKEEGNWTWPQGHIRTFEHRTYRSNRRTTNVEASKEKDATTTNYEAKKCDQHSETTTIRRVKRIVDPTAINWTICHQIRKDHSTTETIWPILRRSTSKSTEKLAPTAKSIPATVPLFSMLNPRHQLQSFQNFNALRHNPSLCNYHQLFIITKRPEKRNKIQFKNHQGGLRKQQGQDWQ